jgi:hypothetical protein
MLICFCMALNLLCVQVLMSASSLSNRRPGDIVRLLQVNPSATLTHTGAIVFGCSLHPEADAPHEHDPAQPPALQQQQQQELQEELQVVLAPKEQAVWDDVDLTKAFALHSRPSATKKIFLEFRGCVTEGTDGWNTYYNISSITTQPYDTDGHTESFTDDELRDIILVHRGTSAQQRHCSRHSGVL